MDDQGSCHPWIKMINHGILYLTVDYYRDSTAFSMQDGIKLSTIVLCVLRLAGWLAVVNWIDHCWLGPASVAAAAAANSCIVSSS